MDDVEQALIGSYTDDVAAIARRDEILDELKLYSKDAQPTVGEYINEAGVLERNPGFAHQALVGTDFDTLSTFPADRAALDYTTRVGATMRGQEAGAHSRFFPQGMGKQKVADMNAVMVEHGPLDDIQRALLTDAADKANVSTVNYGDNTMLTRFGDEGPVAGTTKEILDALNEKGVTSKAVRGTTETGYEPTGLTSPPGQGQATEGLLARSGELGEIIPNLEARTAGAVSRQAKAMNVLDEQVAKATGKPIRKDLMKMREILGDGGLPALRKYVEKYGKEGLPAVLIGLLGVSAGGAPNGSGTGSV
jgi:hypothetical protein